MNAIVTKASQKLRIISVVKRSGYTEPEHLQVYISRIRAILEYVCEIWHPGITLSQVHDIERVQIRVLFIIRSILSYWQALDTFELTTLDDRRKKLFENTFYKIKQPTNMLHYLLPNFRENSHNINSSIQYFYFTWISHTIT